MPHDVSMNVFLGEQIEIFIVQPLFFIAFIKSYLMPSYPEHFPSWIQQD